MVDVSDKEITMREALAVSEIKLPTHILDHMENGELNTKKGPVFHTAIIAGTLAAKKTASLIPFCHPLDVTHVNIAIRIKDSSSILIECLVKCRGKTGVEMEALTGASIAALTIYDMCKSLTIDMEISSTKLMMKTGGKNDR